LYVNSIGKQSVYIEVINLLGQTVDNVKLNEFTGASSVRFCNYQTGVYMVRLKNHTGVIFQQKLIIAN
jgi:hypothetical protein